MNFLVVRTDRLGDTLLTLPLITELKKFLPDSQIYFLCNQYTKPIVEKVKAIEDVILYDRYSSIDLVMMIRKYKIDTTIIARPTFYNAFTIFMSKVPVRIGTAYRWYSFLFSHKVKHHRKHSIKHEALYNLDLLEPIGIKNHNDIFLLDFGLQLNDIVLERVKTKLINLGIDISKPLIVLHVSSGGSAIDWKDINFRALAEKILTEIDCEILLTGTKDKFSELQKLFIDFPYKYWNLAGFFDLWELFHLFSIVQIYVGNSTGTTHLAAISGCWIVSFYPKVKVMSQTRWGPITEKRIIFEPKVNCSECTVTQCKKLNCMDSIEVKDVYYAIEKIINQFRNLK